MTIPFYAPGLYPNNMNVGVGGIHSQTFSHNPRFQPHFAQEMLTRYPLGGPKIFPFLDGLKTVNLDAIEYGFGVKTLHYPSITLAKAIGKSTQNQQQTIYVADTRGLIPNMRFTVLPFGETMEIVQVSGPQELVVTRGVGQVWGWAVPANTRLMFAGSAFEEMSLRPYGRYMGDQRIWTQTQIFRDAWNISGTVSQLKTITGESIIAESKEECSMNHYSSIEHALLLGTIGNSVVNGKPKHTMAGIREYVTMCAPHNVWSVTGGMNYEDLNAMFNTFGEVQVGNVMNPNRVIWADRAFVDGIHYIGREYSQHFGVTIENTGGAFGQRYTKFITNHMNFEVHEHPMLNHLFEGQQQGVGMIADMTSMQVGYLGNRRTQPQFFNMDAAGNVTVQSADNGIDAMGGALLTEMALINKNPTGCGMVFGLTGGRCNGKC